MQRVEIGKGCGLKGKRKRIAASVIDLIWSESDRAYQIVQKQVEGIWCETLGEHKRRDGLKTRELNRVKDAGPEEQKQLWGK
ncbi:hypothetical protein NBRC13296_09910 [Paenibacillus chitinolyticus]|uniref:hypothetical protein n=1 Tax=Paenibacillus chitinolyticus TaxID=79263 RepID=UPI0035571A8D